MDLEERGRLLLDGRNITVGTSTVRVGIVGKYTGLADSYLSVTKSLEHAGLKLNRSVQILWCEASDLEGSMESESTKNAWNKLRMCDGILVPGGFGERGIEGMILAARYARENNVPYLGLCLGLQVAVIEIARNLLGLKDANSTEFNERTPNPVVVFMPEGDETTKGGTMRLGSRKTYFVPQHRKQSVMWQLYGRPEYVQERHRHRYEVEPSIAPLLEEKG